MFEFVLAGCLPPRQSACTTVRSTSRALCGVFSVSVSDLCGRLDSVNPSLPLITEPYGISGLLNARHCRCDSEGRLKCANKRRLFCWRQRISYHFLSASCPSYFNIEVPLKIHSTVVLQKNFFFSLLLFCLPLLSFITGVEKPGDFSLKLITKIISKKKEESLIPSFCTL